MFAALRRAGWKAIMNLDISTTHNDKGTLTRLIARALGVELSIDLRSQQNFDPKCVF